MPQNYITVSLRQWSSWFDRRNACPTPSLVKLLPPSPTKQTQPYYLLKFRFQHQINMYIYFIVELSLHHY
jgi:hypothetical protein